MRRIPVTVFCVEADIISAMSYSRMQLSIWVSGTVLTSLSCAQGNALRESNFGTELRQLLFWKLLRLRMFSTRTYWKWCLLPQHPKSIISQKGPPTNWLWLSPFYTENYQFTQCLKLLLWVQEGKYGAGKKYTNKHSDLWVPGSKGSRRK